LAGQSDDCRIVGHIAGLVEQAVLAVAGVRVERDVGHDSQRRKAGLQSPDGARYQALRIPGRFRVQRFESRLDDREQRHRRNAQRDTALGIAEQQVDTLARYAGQRRHLLFAIAAVENKYRINEIGTGKRGFAH
jgi:hypothetical protein